ncbi:NDxxF motif lipoprotein [Priestia aryabhattai]|uniref:NDxxF motif lipoprotein n=1 Tax=Priestia aryabhattai TaxID=412384 RepID=UPI003CF46E03
MIVTFPHISRTILYQKDIKKESERISRFITGSNQILDELDQAIDDMIEHMSEGDFSETEIESLMNKNKAVNGREQKKIESFLDEKNINTKAFGRRVKQFNRFALVRGSLLLE